MRLSCVSVVSVRPKCMSVACLCVCWAAKPAKCKSISRKIVSIVQYSHTEGPKSGIFGCTKKDVILSKPTKPRARRAPIKNGPSVRRFSRFGPKCEHAKILRRGPKYTGLKRFGPQIYLHGFLLRPLVLRAFQESHLFAGTFLDQNRAADPPNILV